MPAQTPKMWIPTVMFRLLILLTVPLAVLKPSLDGGDLQLS